MKILHTSDLHIGKRLMDRERLPEQKEVLSEIAALAEREGVSLVLIAGDVFDTYLPSAEAEELFFTAVKELAGSDRAVVVVSGNHDDGVRLSASAPFLEEQGVYLFGNKPRAASLNSTRPVRAVEAGEHYLIIEDMRTGECVYLNVLPYPNEARLKEEKTDESYAEKVQRWIMLGEEGYRGDMPHVLLSHLFVAGGRTSESERDIDLGGARAVPLRCFQEHGYVALGHLHKKQKLGENVYYSGSVLPYSFDEAGSEKCVLLLTTKGREFSIKELPLRAGKKLVRLESDGVESALSLLSRYENAYIELTLLLKEPLTAHETEALRSANEGLVSLIVKVQGKQSEFTLSRKSMSAGELFTEYFRSVYGDEPSNELKSAFLELTEADA